MAKKPQSESIIDMFARFGEQMRMPAPDIERIIEHNRRNLEAFEQSARATGEGTSAILKRQREMLQQTLNDFSAMTRDLTSTSDPQDFMRKQAEFARKTFETAVKNTGEMADLVRKSQEQSVEILRERIREGMEEIRGSFRKEG